MLSGIGMEQLRQGAVPRSGLFSSALAFVLGFSVVFVSFGATASAVGGFLKQNRSTLTPVAGALILLFGLHLLGILIKLTPRVGMVLGALLVGLGALSLARHATLFANLGAIHFFSLSIIGFFGPALARWLNRDVHLQSSVAKPGAWSGFLLGFAFAFGWTPCIGPILTTVLAIAAASDQIGRGVLLLAVYSAGLAIPFLLTALGIGQFMAFYKNFRKYLHAVEIFSGALLLFIGGLVFLNRLTWLTGKLGFLDSVVGWLEQVLTSGNHMLWFGLIVGLAALAIALYTLAKNWSAVASFQGRKIVLIVGTVVFLIFITVLADKYTRLPAKTNNFQSAADDSSAKPTPELTLKDLNDKDVSLADYKGKVVLVNFWATWCDPCRIEIPWLIDIQKKYGDKGFTILGISMDEEGKPAVAPFVAKERFDVNGQKLPMQYPILIGSEAAADKFGGLLGYPTSILISRDGKQIKRITGIISYDEIDQAIKSQL
jgi:cytochrome c biogenesis protein CcdA/thiol-disulfide isomerase/thioredoxin